jgi:methyl-accepting chemotaxis protein
MFKNLTIGKRIGGGFGIVVFALLVVGLLSWTGVKSIVGNAQEVIVGNELDAIMTQKEVDHLNWVSQVQALLTDEHIHHLNVETDDHKCGFGKWLYSDERRAAEDQVPGLVQTLKAIEEPHAHLHESAIEIDGHYHYADPSLPGTITNRIVDHMNWADTIRNCFLENKSELKVATDPTQCALGKWIASDECRHSYEQGTSEYRTAYDQMIESHKHLHGSAIHIQEAYSQIHPGLKDLLLARLIDHKNWSGKVAQKLISGESNLEVQTDPTKCALGKFLESSEYKHYASTFPAFRQAMEAVREPHHHLHQSAIAISKALESGNSSEAASIYSEKTLAALDKVGQTFHTVISAEESNMVAQSTALGMFKESTLPLLEETVGHLHGMKTSADNALIGVAKANEVFAKKTVPNLREVQSQLKTAREQVKDAVMTQDEMLGAAQQTKALVGIIGAIGIALGVGLAFIISIGIVKLLTALSGGLDMGADQTASASAQVSSASQSLAQGASEQAASVEETSASLEEMASMIKQNAGAAGEANELASTARNNAEKGGQAMTRMTTAIDEIKKSADETAKIVKTIDEIAFQTNLLALNAAVEAARAGEAGKGFAVVAEEVRNLAQRSAEAAKNTADMIDESVHNAENGVSISKEVAQALEEIADGSTKVNDLISSIAQASHEQTEAIEQISNAVAQMDQVTQSNAANSEESASASEELSAQAEQLKGMVRNLASLVGITGNGAHKQLQQPLMSHHDNDAWSNSNISEFPPRAAATRVGDKQSLETWDMDDVA